MKQLKELVDDIFPQAVKIGMLGERKIVEAVIEGIRKFGLKNIVLDTVLESSSGYPLLDEGGLRLLKEELIPRTLIIVLSSLWGLFFCRLELLLGILVYRAWV